MYDREALLAAVDLAALADDLLGGHVGSQRSPMWHCPNPQHAQTGRTPPLSIFHSHQGEQRWRCHGCGDGGTAIDLVVACKGGSVRDALGYLAGRVGHHDHSIDWTPTGRSAMSRRPVERGCRDREGLQRYVDECAATLWEPDGRAIRRWLTNIRGIPADVLEENRIGADLGSRRQDRPAGMPRALGAVLPTISQGQVVYAQIRVPHPAPGRPRYMNPTSDLAPNPRVTRMRPVECRRPEVIVTEGAIDALSAATAGYRAVGVLSAAYGDEAVAVALARLPQPLVLALDADEAGQAGADRLTALLETRGRTPVRLDIREGDLNDAMRRSDDWPTRLDAAVEQATSAQRSVGASLER
ncbi:MAG: toprim domain-containing protein [Acidimicrobiia bacterium]|nr:toprim domain-containing protein [Acidimicrobiia bacterium]